MLDPGRLNRVLRFGPLELNVDSGELRKSGITLKLRPQAAKVLVLLATRSGEIVTQEQIKEQLWGSGLYVDFEHGMILMPKRQPVPPVALSVIPSGINLSSPLTLQRLPQGKM